MDLSIFEAFPEAIITGTWQIGSCQHGTLVGNEFKKIADIDVIVDEGTNANVGNTIESLVSDLLIYVYPCQAVTWDSNKLVSNYMLYNLVEDSYYEIIDAGIAKNQHTGNVEHIELKVVQTEVVNG